MTGSLRPIAAPLVAAAPGGVLVRARLRLSAGDEAVLRVVGGHLGSLAGKDLAARCATAAERHAKAVRLRSLTARLARVERQLGTG